MKIYISIPITNFDLATQKAKAVEIAEKIKALGHEPVNPFDTPEPPAGLSETQKYAYYMLEDIKRLFHCDAIFMCEGWENSYGCKIELEVAVRMDCNVYQNLADIQHIDISKNTRVLYSMQEHEFDIVIFPKVKNYHTAKLEQLLSSKAEIVGAGVGEGADYDKREFYLTFIGSLAEFKETLPIGFVCRSQNMMLFMPKAELSIQGGRAVVRWHEIKRRKNLKSYIFIPLSNIREESLNIREDFLKEFSELLRKYNAKIDAGCFGRDSDNSFCSVTLGDNLELCWEEEFFKKGGFRFPLTPDNLLKYNK